MTCSIHAFNPNIFFDNMLKMASNASFTFQLLNLSAMAFRFLFLLFLLISFILGLYSENNERG